MWVGMVLQCCRRSKLFCCYFLAEEDKDCDAAECKISESDEVTPTWIGCMCGLWFHLYCVDMDEVTDTFLCSNCSV